MISKIKFNSYKRLKNIEFDLKTGINIIAGNNGTCKSSILHCISNSYKKPIGNSNIFTDINCLKTIHKLNKHVSPKIETLNKLARGYNDPTNGNPGAAYEVTFVDGENQKFRKHNSRSEDSENTNNRYSMKLNYAKGTKQSLREGISIYLSLDRLIPYAEFSDENSIITEKINLPDKYNNLLISSYNKLTLHEISSDISLENMGISKKRSSFSTNKEGIDSNTISSGEDNLLIMLTALYSLVYFSDSLNDNSKNTPAYLLIDEFDAALHPEFQIEFLNLFKEILSKYSNISLVATSHSLSTIEESISEKYNLIYLTKHNDIIIPMDNPDTRKIKANLHTKLYSDFHATTHIPILVEDSEAKIFLEKLFDFFKIEYPEFKNLHDKFSIVDAPFSCESIKRLFCSNNIPRKVFPAIGILDGDQKNEVNLGNCLIALPGSTNPENIIFETCYFLSSDTSEKTLKFFRFMDDRHGFNYDYLMKHIIPDIQNIDSKLECSKSNGEKTKGDRRKYEKDIFKTYNAIFSDLFEFWIEKDSNKKDVEQFYKNIKICFHKVSPYHGLNIKF